MIDRETRKMLGLPLTKDIIYIYPSYRDITEPIKVESIDILMKYTSGNFSLNILLENGEEVCVNSGLLKSVQCGVRYKARDNDLNVWDLDRLTRKLGW